MSSILKFSGNDESKVGASPAPVSAPQDLGTNLEGLRGLTKNAYQERSSTRLRIALLALLLILGLGSLGLVLHNHMPGLVSFGEELSETVQRFASTSPTPSTTERAAALPDLRGARKQVRSSRLRVAESQPDQAFDPAFHPFYATAVVGGRRIPLVSNNSIVVLDVAGGTWKYSSELQ